MQSRVGPIVAQTTNCCKGKGSLTTADDTACLGARECRDPSRKTGHAPHPRKPRRLDRHHHPRGAQAQRLVRGARGRGHRCARVTSRRSRSAPSSCARSRARRVWSAGHDIEELPTDGRDPLGWDDPLPQLIREIEEYNAPVIAMIEGTVWGGACEVAFACDLVIATPATTFAVTPAKLGVPYNVVGHGDVRQCRDAAHHQGDGVHRGAAARDARARARHDQRCRRQRGASPIRRCALRGRSPPMRRFRSP